MWSKIILSAFVLTGIEVLLIQLLGPVPAVAMWKVAGILALVNLGACLLLIHHAAYGILKLPIPGRSLVSGATENTTPVLDPTLRIVRATLPYLRRGLSPATASRVAQIICQVGKVAGVIITDPERVLAASGAGVSCHIVGEPIPIWWAREVLRHGRVKTITRDVDMKCEKKHDCPRCYLAAGVIVPITFRKQIAGTVQLYQTHPGPVASSFTGLATAVAQILGLQMELAHLGRQAELAKEAELNALRAQINPHFLFNVLNTIASYCHTDPIKTRQLLVRLADFLRLAFKSTGQFVTFREEFYAIRTYLYLEKARFGDRLKVRYDIDPMVLKATIPALTVQPLVENAVRHGIGPKVGIGTVTVSAFLDFLHLRTNIIIGDDGVGMPPERVNEVFQPGDETGTNSVGLYNIYERLKRLYGERFQFRIDTQVNQGTRVHLVIPIK